MTTWTRSLPRAEPPPGSNSLARMLRNIATGLARGTVTQRDEGTAQNPPRRFARQTFFFRAPRRKPSRFRTRRHIRDFNGQHAGERRIRQTRTLTVDTTTVPPDVSHPRSSTLISFVRSLSDRAKLRLERSHRLRRLRAHRIPPSSGPRALRVRLVRRKRQRCRSAASPCVSRCDPRDPRIAPPPPRASPSSVSRRRRRIQRAARRS